MKHHRSLAALLFLGLALAAIQSLGQSVYTPYSFISLAGSGSIGSADGIGQAASFNNPSGITADNAGNLYVADSWNHMIRKIAPGAVVTTLAASTNLGSADGIGSAAQFYYPFSVAVDSVGNIYVADSGNHTIRQVTPAGEVRTVAGQAGNAGNADGTGSVAQFNFPKGIAVDSAGNIFVADTGNHAIRQVTPGGEVTTVAGQAGNAGSADGAGRAAQFNLPSGIAVDRAGNIYVADESNHTIRKVTSAGMVTTVAGLAGEPGSADGFGGAARFQAPSGVAVDSAGNIYVADSFNATIRKVTASCVVTTLGGVAGTTGDGGRTGVVGYPADGAGRPPDSESRKGSLWTVRTISTRLELSPRSWLPRILRCPWPTGRDSALPPKFFRVSSSSMIFRRRTTRSGSIVCARLKPQ